MPKLTKEQHQAIGARSRRKGVANERDMANKFGEWWGTPVQRTPMSGAYKNREFELNGDLMFSRQDRFPFHVELKAREAWTLEHLMQESVGPVLGWWEQTVDEASFYDRLPMLVFTRNQQPQFLVLQHEDFERVVGGRTWERPMLLRQWGERAIAIVLLDDFFELVAPDVVRGIRNTETRHSSEPEGIDFS